MSLPKLWGRYRGGALSVPPLSFYWSPNLSTFTDSIKRVVNDVNIIFCKDVGMFSINRSCASCKHATSFCSENCYNIKLYKAFGHVIRPADERNDLTWDVLNGFWLDKFLSRKRNQTHHVRFASRGEALADVEDVYKVAEIVSYNKDRMFSLPTRGWRDKEIKEACEKILFPIKNIYMRASIDPSNPDKEVDALKEAGWPTFFFGDDSKIKGRFKCPKTWKHLRGVCPKCKKGCFSDKRVDIHLKQH